MLKVHSAMDPSQHHFPFHPEFPDPTPGPTSRIGRDQQNQNKLPPIRQAIPELQLDVRPDVARTPPSAVSSVGAQLTGSLTPPEYVHSPTGAKRRRLSADEETEFDRAHRVPRFYGLPQPGSQQQSPTYRPGVPYPDSSSFSGPGSLLGRPIRTSPANSETHDLVEARPMLPSFPLLEFERGVSERMLGHTSDDYMAESSRRNSLAHSVVPVTSPYLDHGSQGYRSIGFAHSYHHPNRLQSLSVGSAHFDLPPYSPGVYGPSFPEMYMRVGDYAVPGGEGKQRKRRGNLPKETTDILRRWFIGHLNHPYPTEDEKQELMKQTGLQMNQISNWFINARRRQLPTMINNARAESEATSRAAVNTSLPDHDPGGKQQGDSEGGDYEDYELDSAVKRHRKNDLKRGSI
ncbi:hypothetical protein F5Y01DRAFT_68090 [Xylaria sp. FL0043]|nr:hypothetical protein F5Y01DRAFT_68090 [Xylaria sp. FL0043]